MGNIVSRLNGRAVNALRPFYFTRHYTKHAEGSVLAQCGDTHVICTASIEDRVPAFLKGKSQGWLTAEYGMLPRATHTRVDREAVKGKQSGRTQEIQRLIGRALRAAFDLTVLGERTLHLDCDVIQADGGTRTIAITGAMVAAYDAITLLQSTTTLQNPLQHFVAAISVGIVDGVPMLDLDYAEDVRCHTDMNIVMADNGHFIEVQGTAEGMTFDRHHLDHLLDLAQHGIQQIHQLQKQVLGM